MLIVVTLATYYDMTRICASGEFFWLEKNKGGRSVWQGVGKKDVEMGHAQYLKHIQFFFQICHTMKEKRILSLKI